VLTVVDIVQGLIGSDLYQTISALASVVGASSGTEFHSIMHLVLISPVLVPVVVKRRRSQIWGWLVGLVSKTAINYLINRFVFSGRGF
jgi:hypothetical protein